MRKWERKKCLLDANREVLSNGVLYDLHERLAALTLNRGDLHFVQQFD